jgi:alkylation response protein AidB-like acyl-CoA dehydrogenase
MSSEAALADDTVKLAYAVLSANAGDDAAAQIAALGETGLIGLGIEESRGGSGGSIALAFLVAEQAGRTLAHPAVLHQMGAALILGGVDAPADDVADVVRGQRTVLTALATSSAVDVTIPFAYSAERLFIVTPNSLRISDVQRDAMSGEGSWRHPDWAEHRVRVTAQHHGREWQCKGEPQKAALSALAGFYALGAASALLRDTATYTGHREQFGAPIATFQAVSHPLASCWIALHHARELNIASAEHVAGDWTDLYVAAHAALTTGLHTAETCLHAMGGIGFTWDADPHRYLKTVLRLNNWPEPAINRRRQLRTLLIHDYAQAR